jgi:ribonucleoside-triphosphate reductase
MNVKLVVGGCNMEQEICGLECQVYSRVVGYFRPVQMWNVGKREEFKDRLEFDQKKLDKELKDMVSK